MRNKKAVSIIEVLVVLSILLLAMLPILSLHRGQTVQASHSGALLRSHAILVELMAEGEGKLFSTRFKETPFTIGPRQKKRPWGKSSIEVTETISAQPSTKTTGLYELRANLTWPENRGTVVVQQQQSMIMLVCDPLAHERGESL